MGCRRVAANIPPGMRHLRTSTLTHSHIHPDTVSHLYAHSHNFTYAHTHPDVTSGPRTYEHTFLSPSLPDVRQTLGLTLVQEARHIKSIFKKDLKERTMLPVSALTLQSAACPGLQGQELQTGSLLASCTAHMSNLAPNSGSLFSDLPRELLRGRERAGDCYP